MIFADSSGVEGGRGGMGGGIGPNAVMKKGAAGGTPVKSGCIPAATTVTNVRIAASQMAGLAGIGVSGSFAAGSSVLSKAGKSASSNTPIAASIVGARTPGVISFE